MYGSNNIKAMEQYISNMYGSGVNDTRLRQVQVFSVCLLFRIFGLLDTFTA